MHIVMFVLDDPTFLDEVLNAWESIGVSGVTIIESTGINRRKRARQVGSMVMAGFNRLMSSDEESHYTLFTIVQDMEMVQNCIDAVEKIVGDLNLPDSGVLASWPLGLVKGVQASDSTSKD